MSKISLPGSTGEEAEIGRGGGLGDGDAAALAGLLSWWRHRLARGDAADPLESGFGGVDDSGVAQTVGAAAATVLFPRPLVVPPGGVGLWVVALGVPRPATLGVVYSLAGLCHIFREPAGSWLIGYTTVARVPAAPLTEVRAVLLGPPANAPALQLVGAPGVTIDWKVEVYRVERIRN